MTNYGRGRSQRQTHLRREDDDNRSGSLCGLADWDRCVSTDCFPIVDCRRCRRLYEKRVMATEQKGHELAQKLRRARGELPIYPPLSQAKS